MDSHKDCADGFVYGILDMSNGVINTSTDRTVILKDVQTKVSLWFERSRRRIEQCDKNTDELAALAAVTIPESESVPESPVTWSAGLGIPATQLHRQLELIKLRHKGVIDYGN